MDMYFFKIFLLFLLLNNKILNCNILASSYLRDATYHFYQGLEMSSYFLPIRMIGLSSDSGFCFSTIYFVMFILFPRFPHNSQRLRLFFRCESSSAIFCTKQRLYHPHCVFQCLDPPVLCRFWSLRHRSMARFRDRKEWVWIQYLLASLVS